MPVPNFMSLCGVRATDKPDVFEGVSLPKAMGNVRPIAYGGFAVATAIVAAGQTIPHDRPLAPYSVLGQFLGPATLKNPYVCEVQRVRDTRSFSTRIVLVRQKDKNGELRNVLSLTLDMIAAPNATHAALEKAKANNVDPACVGSLLRYQPSPQWKLKSPKDLPSFDEAMQQRIKDGDISKEAVDMQSQFVALWNSLFQMRPVPESMLYHNLMGFTDNPTPQDHLPMLQRRSFDWMHLIDHLPAADGADGPVPDGPDGMLPVLPAIAHVALMAFALDGAIAFAPLSMSNRSLFDAQAASTLEFAQRFHTDVPDMNQWLLREIVPVNAGWGRTYSEARLFAEDGTHVATCTQQCVMMPADKDAVAYQPPLEPSREFSAAPQDSRARL